MIAPRIYVDFHNADAEGRLRLNSTGTLRDLSAQQIELKEGLRLSLYSDDLSEVGELDELMAEGVVVYSQQERAWVAVIDWNAIRHSSEVSREEKLNGANRNTQSKTRQS